MAVAEVTSPPLGLAPDCQAFHGVAPSAVAKEPLVVCWSSTEYRAGPPTDTGLPGLGRYTQYTFVVPARKSRAPLSARPPCGLFVMLPNGADPSRGCPSPFPIASTQ